MTMETAEADRHAIGANSRAVGEMLDDNPVLIFQEPGMLEQLADDLEAKIAEQPTDISDPKVRDGIASFAYGIARRKNTLDTAGKLLTEAHRKAVSDVNAKRRVVWDRLEELQAKARKPLTDWEAAEEVKTKQVMEARALFAAASNPSANVTIDVAKKFRDDVASTKIDPSIFGDLRDLATQEQADAIKSLTALIVRLEKDAAEKAELESLRAAAAARAAEDQKAKDEAERQRLEDARVATAAQDAKDAADRQSKAAIEAANQRAAAAEKARDDERKAQAARDAKAEADRLAEAAAEEKRAANVRHRHKLMTAAAAAISENCQLSEATALKIVNAVIAGSVPNMEFKF